MATGDRGRDAGTPPAVAAAPGRRRFAAAAERNQGPILAVLERVLPATGVVLEVASGTGQHAVYFASRLPGLVWQPSDPDPAMRASIAARAVAAGLPNLRPPLDLDVTAGPWPVGAADAVVAINLIHIAPWEAGRALMAGAGRLLGAGDVLYLYGAFRIGGRHTAPGNVAFDAALRRRDPAWGVRDLDAVAAEAAAHGLALAETVSMPADNLSVVFRKG